MGELEGGGIVPRCPVCHQSQARAVVESDFNLTGAAGSCYRVVECRGCRMRYLHPRPAAEELARFYQADYPAHVEMNGDGRVDRAQRSLQRRFRKVAKLRIRLLRRFLGQPIAGQRVLDIGCGNGAFLLGLLRRYAVEAWGVDIAGHALQQLGQLEPRLHLVEGNLADADLPAAHFDVITLWHVLEHDGDPVRNLERIKGWLRPGGLLLAEVPDSAGWIARLCGRHWLGWDLPRHLVHFTPDTLRQAARQAGLERVRVRHEYTLNPVCLSPLLASLALWRERRRGKKRLKPVPYHRFDGWAGAALRMVNGVERLLGGNGLLLAATAPLRKGDRSCTT